MSLQQTTAAENFVMIAGVAMAFVNASQSPDQQLFILLVKLTLSVIDVILYSH